MKPTRTVRHGRPGTLVGALRWTRPVPADTPATPAPAAPRPRNPGVAYDEVWPGDPYPEDDQEQEP